MSFKKPEKLFLKTTSRKTFAQYYMTLTLLAFPNMRFISAVGALASEFHSFGFGLTRLETEKCQRLSEFIFKKKFFYSYTVFKMSFFVATIHF